MLQYILEIVIPYVEQVRAAVSKPDDPALVIMDNFKDQVTEPDVS